MRKGDVRVKSSGHGKWGRKGAGKLVSLMFDHRVEIIQIHTPHTHTYAHSRTHAQQAQAARVPSGPRTDFRGQVYMSVYTYMYIYIHVCM